MNIEPVSFKDNQFCLLLFCLYFLFDVVLVLFICLFFFVFFTEGNNNCNCFKDMASNSENPVICILLIVKTC